MKKYKGRVVGLFLCFVLLGILFSGAILLMFGDKTMIIDVKRAMIAPVLALAVGVLAFVVRNKIF